MRGEIKQVIRFFKRVIIETKIARLDTKFMMGNISSEEYFKKLEILDKKYNKTLEQYGQ